jgi:hypothetical protein
LKSVTDWVYQGFFGKFLGKLSVTMIFVALMNICHTNNDKYCHKDK